MTEMELSSPETLQKFMPQEVKGESEIPTSLHKIKAVIPEPIKQAKSQELIEMNNENQPKEAENRSNLKSEAKDEESGSKEEQKNILTIDKNEEKTLFNTTFMNAIKNAPHRKKSTALKNLLEKRNENESFPL